MVSLGLRWSLDAGTRGGTENSGHRFTATSLYLRACAQYQHAEHFRHPKDAAALEIFRRSLQCFDKFIQLTDRPRIEKVGYLVQVWATPATLSTPSTAKAIVFLVSSVWWLRHAEGSFSNSGGWETSRAGFSVLLVDGPGMGESIRFHNIRCMRITSWWAARVSTTWQRGQTSTMTGGRGCPEPRGYFAPHVHPSIIASRRAWPGGRNGMLRPLGKAPRADTQRRVGRASGTVDHVRWVFGVDSLSKP